jgi:hypothetical protein
MKNRALHCALMIVAVVGSSSLQPTVGQSQEAQKEELKKQNNLPPSGSAGGTTHPDQNAKQESSSKVEGTNPSPEAFVNGALTAPGAPTDVDTIPSKFSERTAADDKLPIAAYRFKHLTRDQLKDVREAIGQTSPQGSGSRAIGGYAHIGAEIPSIVALNGLRPLPTPVLAQLPSMKGVAFTLSEDKVLLVNANTRVVMGVLE